MTRGLRGLLYVLAAISIGLSLHRADAFLAPLLPRSRPSCVIATLRRTTGEPSFRDNVRVLASFKADDVRPNSTQGPDDRPPGFKKETVVTAIVVAALVIAFGSQAGTLQASLTSALESSVAKIAGMGNMGYLYFALIYIAAEILAIPVFPLTASSGYLFGIVPGTLTVLISATVAACISFTIGRTVLRGWATKFTNEWPKWKAIDGAISKEGFKVILLLRLSPLLPFAVSNYLYGITSVDFASFLAATFFGFAPGTLGIVYAGSAGKAFFSEGGSLPWYVFLGVGGVIIFAAQTLAKVAGDAIKSIEDEQKNALPPPAGGGPAAKPPL